MKPRPGVFMVITGFMALFPLLTPRSVQLNDYADFFAKTSSVYTGIIGVTIGFYCGRPTEPPPGRPGGPGGPAVPRRAAGES
ncbi:MAG TPA: hypothetical protein VFU46_13835 [Gemmatimonadales bacterium]|nr:hypothetical protein [Gemmatimonadales bacterium]